MAPPVGIVSPFTMAAVTSSTQGTTGPFDCRGWASLSAMLSVTTGTPTNGSVSTFKVWLQGQFNEGGVWNDLGLLSVVKTFTSGNLAVGAASVLTASSLVLANEVSLFSAVGCSFVGRMNCPPPLVRVAYNIVVVSGAPFVTFGVEGILSQIAAP